MYECGRIRYSCTKGNTFGAGSGNDHAAHMYDTDRECGVERFAIDGELDADTDTGRDNLYRERYELYGHGHGQ